MEGDDREAMISAALHLRVLALFAHRHGGAGRGDTDKSSPRFTPSLVACNISSAIIQTREETILTTSVTFAGVE